MELQGEDWNLLSSSVKKIPECLNISSQGVPTNVAFTINVMLLLLAQKSEPTALGRSRRMTTKQSPSRN